MQKTFDVVVIGASSAGCVVAARLAERERSVLLLDAGPDYGEYPGQWPADLANARVAFLPAGGK